MCRYMSSYIINKKLRKAILARRGCLKRYRIGKGILPVHVYPGQVRVAVHRFLG